MAGAWFAYSLRQTSLSLPIRAGTLFPLGIYFLVAMSQRMVDLHQIIFGGLTRKMQERQAFCEGAYPQWSVTEQNTKYFTVFFRQKSTK